MPKKLKPARKWRNRIVGHDEVDPEQLLANPKNWRIHPKEQQQALEGVLAEVGWVQDVIVNERTGFVVDGHARVALAITAGERVPVVYVDLSEDEERLILATLDPLSAMAVTDKELLGDLLKDLEVTNESIKAMLADLEGNKIKPGLTDADDCPAVPVAPVTQLGDLWLLGGHRVLCGDSTDADSVARLIGSEKADVMWTDPPYGVNYVGKTTDQLRIAGDSGESLSALVAGFVGVASTVLDESAPFYIAHPPGALCITFWEAVRDAGWRIHQSLIWVKDSMVLGHSDYHFQHEPILYGYTPGIGRPGRGNHVGSKWHGDHSQVSVFRIDRPKRSSEHPTMKPVALVAQCLGNSASADGVVYDPFGGSGATVIACEELGMRCRALDVDPAYCDVIVQRWQDFTGKQATLEGHDGLTFDSVKQGRRMQAEDELKEEALSRGGK